MRLRTPTIAAGLAVTWSAIFLGQVAGAQTPAAPIPLPATVPAPASQGTQAPVFGPAPAWVTPLAIPSAATSDDAPVRVLLQDQQVSFEAGHQTTYTEVALKIQNPSGLAAGNISLPWRPDTDVLTVHKFQILRGDQVIDILASGQTFTVIRREQNLESAILDGVLTATMQPEGLQVGDVLVLATTISTSDPVLGPNVEQMGASWNDLPVTRAHLSVQWPESLHISQRLTASLPATRVTRRAGKMRFEMSLDNLEPIPGPRGAPARYGIIRLAEFTSFGAWSDVGALMAPLYARASTLPAEGPLLAEVERIRNSSADPVVRAQGALELVQNRIRYVALAMGRGGLVPADAATTWSRRFGDCKAKTALLIAILHALGIEAEPVAVSTVFGDGLDQRLPMISLFDHVLVRATIAGKTYWLDGTRIGDTRLDGIEVPNFSWGLPLVAEGGALVRMQPEPYTTPDQVTTVRIDASAGLMTPAPIHAEYTLRGDVAVTGNIAYSGVTADVRDRTLRTYWRQEYDDVEITSATVSFDAQTRELHFVMDGRLPMDWSSGRYRADSASIGYRADFNREPGPNNDAPFAVPHPYYRQVNETIVLPAAGFRIDNGEDVNQTIAGIAYRRHTAMNGATFTAEVSEKSVAPEFPASEAPAAQTTLRSLANRNVSLVRPANYRTSAADLALQTAATPTDLAGFMRRGNAYLESGRTDDAIADFNRAAALDPRNAMVLANRAVAYVVKEDVQAATRDLDAAAAIDPNNVVVFRARGMMAQHAGNTAEAITAFSRALAIDPNDTFSLSNRAQAYRTAGEDDRALADSAAALQQRPDSTDTYRLRANIFLTRGDRPQAVIEADRLAGVAHDTYGHVVAAQIYHRAHRDEESMREFDRAIAIAPEAYIYLNRAQARPAADVTGRRADIDEALRLEPGTFEALSLKGDLLEEQHDYQGAIGVWTDVLHASPNDTYVLTRRGVNYVLAGRQALADADFAAARAHANQAQELNSMCWAKATANVALESALSDCDAALVLAPASAPTMDSRAFVLLRLGRLDDAIAQYDRALAIQPRLSASLYGRGLAWERKGDQAKADADIAAAVQVDEGIRARFDGYGVTRASH